MSASLNTIVGVDIGGTFTDIVVWHPDHGLTTRKVLSTPADYSLAIINGLTSIAKECGFALSSIREVAHGTTLGTNAMLERKGATTALVTTKGFLDVMTFRYGRQGEPFNFNWDPPEALVPRRRRVAVSERVSSNGEVVRPLDESEVVAIAKTLREWNVESIAISLINSYVNGSHEEKVREILKKSLGNIPISLSSELFPEVGEFERTSTTIANAYIAPILDKYLTKLRQSLDEKKIHGPLFVCQSSGGLFLHSFAKQKPALTLESGPAAGCVAARHYARSLEIDHAVAVDMGGTTTKATFIDHGELGWASKFVVGAPMSTGSRLDTGVGYTIRTPSIDIAEVGAGGGSLAWIDVGGVLHIGPESAGAAPGPACYDLGGTRPTLTDANVVLGYMNPKALAGGTFPIDKSKAEKSLKELGDQLGKSVEETAYGIHLIANANMVTAIRRVSTEFGRDLRNADMIAFGGSGPIQGIGLAKSLEMRRVFVPRYPGLFSGYGLLTANIEHHAIRSVVQSLPELNVPGVNKTLEELEDTVTRELRDHGFPMDKLAIERLAEFKFDDRSGEIVLPLPSRPLVSEDLPALEKAFLETYDRIHNYTPKGSGVQLQNVRVVARISREIEGLGVGLTGIEWRPTEKSRQAYFGPSVGFVETPILSRMDLRSGTVKGPVIIEEADSSTVVQPGCAVGLGKDDVIVVSLS